MPANEIEDLLQKYAAGGLSAADRDRLLLILQDEAQRDKVIGYLQQAMLNEPAEALFDEARFLPLMQNVLEADKVRSADSGKYVTGRRSFTGRSFTIWRTAAAVLILAIGSALAYVVMHHPGPGTDERGGKMPVMADAFPGGNKAVLTMANGVRIVLDSAHSGLLADLDGVRVVKTDSGRVSFVAGKENVASPANNGIAGNLLTTPRGGQYQLGLPDGTQVWLNAASSIQYPTVFNGPERRVVVTGEAYFEVAKNRNKPFFVEANGTEVKVLGTHFNINAYEDEADIRTTLLEGMVQVADIATKEAVLLKPGQEAQAGHGTSEANAGSPDRIRVKAADTVQALAWKNGLFQFRHADLQTVMRQLARWYDLDVVYEGQVPEDRFDGKIPRDAMAAQVLAVLEKNQIHFRIEGKRLIVMP